MESWRRRQRRKQYAPQTFLRATHRTGLPVVSKFTVTSEHRPIRSFPSSNANVSWTD